MLPKTSRKIGDPKIVGHSYGPRTVIARLSLGARKVPVKSHGYRAVTTRQPDSGRTLAVQGP